MSLTARLKQRALELGFDLAGAAPATPAAHGEHLREWLARNYQGEMAYMAERVAERCDPQVFAPGARSVFVVAMSYHQPAHSGRPVARYALGRDYHNVFKRRLRRLRQFYFEVTGNREIARAQADTAPVLERYWAEAAGLGWIGKSANLVTRSHSSWVLLGTLILGEELDYDTPHRALCGRCRSCIDACPTGAIVAEGVVDARLCISYLTIELRSAIPEALRPAIGDHLFGCDDCQEVCPYERFTPGAPNPALGVRPDVAALEPRWLLEVDDATLSDFTRGSPLARPGPQGLRRNALVVLGNRDDPADLPLLQRYLEHSDPLLREHAAWALRQRGQSLPGAPQAP